MTVGFWKVYAVAKNGLHYNQRTTPALESRLAVPCLNGGARHASLFRPNSPISFASAENLIDIVICLC